ncbi:MAG: hypothetical protein HFI88_14900 [Lachnospiraceae bacterium]|nr:hypothetical protein [Lachnospiraceae bacterium]
MSSQFFFSSIIESFISKPYDYFEYLPTEIPNHLDNTDRSFLDGLVTEPASELPQTQ